MIVPMTKAYVVTLMHRATHTLESLAHVGLLHVETHGIEPSSALEQSQHRLADLERAITILEAYKPARSAKTSVEAAQVERSATDAPGAAAHARGFDLARQILQKASRLETLEKEQRELLVLEKSLTPWGDFSLDDIAFLQQKGVYTALLAWQGKGVPALDEATQAAHGVLVPLFTQGGFQYGVIFAQEEISLPEGCQAVEHKKGLRAVQAELASLDAEKEELIHWLQGVAGQLPLLERAVAEASEAVHFEEARCALTDTGEAVVYISGYIPTKQVQALQQCAKDSAFGLILGEPAEEDMVPTQLKFNKFSRLMQPLYGILGIVPGYRELDISTLFLLFFAIFVGLLIGDAGYGILMGAGAFGLWAKTKKCTSGVLLLGLLSVVITSWGVVTGNWFGSAALGATPFVKGLTIQSIAAFPEVFGLDAASSQERIIHISFLLGTIQLSIANGLNVYRSRKSLRAFAHVGWGVFTVSIYRLALNLILDMDFPAWGLWGLVAGAVLVLLFGAQEDGKSFVHGVVQGLKGGFFQFLDMVGVFSNIVSYIRLFAVGLSSVAIAISFNSLGGDLMGTPIGLIFGVIIVVFGHSLNFAMGLLSMLVHGARLNLLEFSGQLNIEWSGIPYKPLEKQYQKGYDTRRR